MGSGASGDKSRWEGGKQQRVSGPGGVGGGNQKWGRARRLEPAQAIWRRTVGGRKPEQKVKKKGEKTKKKKTGPARPRRAGGTKKS